MPVHKDIPAGLLWQLLLIVVAVVAVERVQLVLAEIHLQQPAQAATDILGHLQEIPMQVVVAVVAVVVPAARVVVALVVLVTQAALV